MSDFCDLAAGFITSGVQSTIMSGGENDQKLIEVQDRNNIVKIDIFETVKDA